MERVFQFRTSCYIQIALNVEGKTALLKLVELKATEISRSPLFVSV